MGALKRVQFCSRQNCQENADPAVRRDLEHWFNRLAPENDPLYTHQSEGPDDMPGHIKSALTATHLSIPVSGGCLARGTWQGIYLWEHRHKHGARQIVVHLARERPPDHRAVRFLEIADHDGPCCRERRRSGANRSRWFRYLLE